MIRIQHAYKAFDTKKIFEDLNLEISQPGFYVLWGKSGCGKSTLLNIIASFDTFDQGTLEVDAQVMTIFQSYELIDTLSVQDNIFLTRKPTASDIELIDRLGLSALLNQYPKELSGGQKQRVGIARALLRHPLIICCDEPTESLDVENQKIVLDILKEYAKHHIVLMVTHQKEVIRHYADHVFAYQNHNLQLVSREGFETNTFAKDEQKIPSKKKIRHLIHQIIHQSNRWILTVCVICMLLAQVSVLLKQYLFTIPSSTNVVNANFMYVKTDSTNELPTSKRIVSFKNLYYNNEEYLTNIYPYESNDLVLEGNVPEGTNVVVNQVVANTLFNGSAINQTLSLPYVVDVFVFSVDVTIVGVIQEPDTKQMNIYYDLDGITSTFSSMTVNEDIPLLSYFNAGSGEFKVSVPYDEISSFKQSHPTLRLHNPLYDEREEMKESSMIYEYMFMGFTCMIVVLLGILICYITNRQTITFQKSMVILSSIGISMKYLLQQYKKEKIIPMLCISIIDICILIGIQVFMKQLSIIFPLCIVIGMNILQYITLQISMHKLMKGKMIDILKEDN